MTDTAIPNFSRIFTAHRECCRQMLELSRRQIRLIEEDDYTQLLTLLGKKQKLLTRLEEFSKHRPQIRELWKSTRDSLDVESRRQCEELLDDTEALLADLTQQEQSSTDRLEKRRCSVQQELSNISAGGRVNEAYRETLAPATHRRLDVGR